MILLTSLSNGWLKQKTYFISKNLESGYHNELKISFAIRTDK